MKILLVIGHEGIYSGASYQALYLGQGLKDRGHELHCVWGPAAGDPSLEKVTEAGLKLHTISMKKKLELNAIGTLRRLLKSEKFDAVHCFKGMAMYRVLWASWGLPIPALIFNREVSKPLEYFQGSKYRSAKVDRVVADSQAVRQILIHSGRLHPEKVVVIYDEVDLERYRPEVSGAMVRREFGIEDKDFLCGVVGNYAPWRGQEYFLQAAAQIAAAGSEFDHVKFLLVGKETDYLQPLSRELNLTGRLHFTGFRKDLEQVVAAMDLVVNCSIEVESLSGAVTIAMACGKPVVGTSIAGTPELVEEGLTGFLVPPRDDRALADAIMKSARLTTAQRAEMGKSGREKMERQFSRRVRAEQMEALYQKVIRGKERKA